MTEEIGYLFNELLEKLSCGRILLYICIGLRRRGVNFFPPNWNKIERDKEFITQDGEETEDGEIKELEKSNLENYPILRGYEDVFQMNYLDYLLRECLIFSLILFQGQNQCQRFLIE